MGLELIFFCFAGGVLSKFLLDNSSFSAPPTPPPDNYCTVPKLEGSCKHNQLEKFGMPNLSPKVICFKILAVLEMDSILDFKSGSLMCRVKGMPEIQTKRFLWVAFHRFPLSIDKITRSLPIFIDFVFYPLVTPGSNYTRN